MNNRIVRIGLAAVAVAVLAFIGINLLAGRGTGAQLTPSSAQAQAPALPSPVASAKAGGLDLSFGGDGKVVTNLTRRNDAASALAIQADGKIVLARGGGFGVARYSSDGTPDASFSGDGRAFVNFTSGFNSASAVAIQADGKIVAVGMTGSGPDKHPMFALARWNSDGTLDATFGVNGKVMTDFTSGTDFAEAVAIQADGKIIAVGEAGPGKFALARYNSDGTLDATFGVNGKVMTDFTARYESATGVAIQADGKIVLVGIAGSTKFALARYNSDGTLDATFGVNGKVMTDFTPGADFAKGVAIQADGKIVAAGTAGSGPDTHPVFGLARWNSDGTLDATFGVNGKVMTEFSPRSDGANGVAIQADGKIVGRRLVEIRKPQPQVRPRPLQQRRHPRRNLRRQRQGDDRLHPGSAGAAGVAIQADGRIVVAGWAQGRSWIRSPSPDTWPQQPGARRQRRRSPAVPRPALRRPRRASATASIWSGPTSPRASTRGPRPATRSATGR